MLFQLEKLAHINIYKYLNVICSGEFGEYSETVYGFVLGDIRNNSERAFANFLDGWLKFKGLIGNNTIDDEVYELWKEKELKKLSQYKADDLRFNELPF